MDPIADRELAAIQVVLRALSALDSDARERVIDYVFQRLGLQAARERDESRQATERLAGNPTPATHEPRPSGVPRDIRSLREEKQPRSAVEMAVLVAYYLAELAPDGTRKASIGTEDITTFFKQAGYPLPSAPRQTLFNAKAAGYLDSPSQGAYVLNPVGHNLVAHNLPVKGADSGTSLPRRGARKSSRGKVGSRAKGAPKPGRRK